jgi:hypothetical protein
MLNPRWIFRCYFLAKTCLVLLLVHELSCIVRLEISSNVFHLHGLVNPRIILLGNVFNIFQLHKFVFFLRVRLSLILPARIVRLVWVRRL